MKWLRRLVPAGLVVAAIVGGGIVSSASADQFDGIFRCRSIQWHKADASLAQFCSDPQEGWPGSGGYVHVNAGPGWWRSASVKAFSKEGTPYRVEYFNNTKGKKCGSWVATNYTGYREFPFPSGCVESGNDIYILIDNHSNYDKNPHEYDGQFIHWITT